MITLPAYIHVSRHAVYNYILIYALIFADTKAYGFPPVLADVPRPRSWHPPGYPKPSLWEVSVLVGQSIGARWWGQPRLRVLHWEMWVVLVYHEKNLVV